MRRRTPIHKALYRPAFFLGVPRVLVVLEGTFLLAFVMGAGLSLRTVVAVVVGVMVVHPGMVYAFAQDSAAMQVFLRSFALRRFYSAQPAMRAPKVAVRRSVPKR